MKGSVVEQLKMNKLMMMPSEKDGKRMIEKRSCLFGGWFMDDEIMCTTNDSILN